MQNIVRISGVLKIKRNRTYVSRYVEVTDTSLTYYKNKGDNTPRYIIYLKEAHYAENPQDDHGSIILTAKEDQSPKESKAQVKLKFSSESEFRIWKNAIMEAMKASQGYEIIDRKEYNMSINSEKGLQAFKQNRPTEEEKEERQDQGPRLSSTRKMGSIGYNPNRHTVNNRSSLSTIFPQPLNTGEQELFVNSAGESLPALKAQVFSFKKEAFEPLVLVDSKENHRVFLGPKVAISAENKPQKEMNLWEQALEKVSETLSLNEFFGPLYRNVICGIIGFLMLFAVYLIFELINPFLLILLVLIAGYLLNLQFKWFDTVLKLVLENHAKDIPIKKVSEYVEGKLQALNSVPTEFEYKLKAVTVMRASISEILYVLNHVETRKYWQSFVVDVEVQGKQNHMRFNYDGKKATETFSLTIYKEDGIIFIIEHQDIKILRIIELLPSGLYNIATLYTKVSSMNLSTANPMECPFLLNGLNSYITEQRADSNSLLYKTYAGKFANNVWSLRDTFIEGEATPFHESVAEPAPLIEEEEFSQYSGSDANKNAISSIPKLSIFEHPDESDTKEEKLVKYREQGSKIQQRIQDLLKASKEAGWESLENNNEVTIQMGPGGGGSEIQIITEVIIKSDLEKVLKTLEDPTEWAKYDENLESGGILEVLDQDLTLEHLKFEEDTYFSAYDYTSLKYKIIEPQGKHHLVFGSIEDSRASHEEEYCRVDIKCGGWILSRISKDNSATKVNYVLWVDFKEALKTNWIKKAARSQAMKPIMLRKYLNPS